MQLWNSTVNTGADDWKRNVRDAWLLDFARNCLGYATILVPGFLFVRYFQRQREWFDLTHPSNLWTNFITLFVFGWKRPDLDSKSSPSDLTSRQQLLLERLRASKFGQFCLLAFCSIGLLFSHLVWGFYQEKMMTRDYYSTIEDFSAGSSQTTPTRERFRDSQFIVFLNRIAALALSMTYLVANYLFRKREQSFEHAAPFYKYSYASLSNILSSWCQYEALKYISFPTQVLGKASKIIPTMLVGRILHKKSFACHQYVIAGFISAGVSLFLLSGTEPTGGRGKVSDATSISGLVLIIGYLICDSFTSNWQSSLFQEYAVGEMQMMCGVNLFSSLFTLIPLLEQGTFVKSLKFMARHRDFFFDCITTSLCSATGQLFIFFTISEFGAVALAIIMTVRQAFAILLSCLYYGHRISQLGILGLCIVFIALFVGQYLNRRWGGERKGVARRRT